MAELMDQEEEDQQRELEALEREIELLAERRR
jgi:hypothetical protein